jgi:anaerobic ribonucleoside-triphosphate reductase
MVESKTQVKSKTKVPCEVYSRIVGYLRPTQNWNDGKQQEFADRKTFQVPQNEEE